MRESNFFEQFEALVDEDVQVNKSNLDYLAEEHPELLSSMKDDVGDTILHKLCKAQHLSTEEAHDLPQPMNHVGQTPSDIAREEEMRDRIDDMFDAA